MDTKRPSISSLRSEIDGIDDALHELIMRRAAVVEQVFELKQATLVSLLQPHREAEIVRRLVAHHHGPFPKATMVRVWREILSAMISRHPGFAIAVCMPERGAGYLELARDHFGAYTPMTVLRSPGQVVRTVADGGATVGVVPLPGSEEGDTWWSALLGETRETPRIVSRLPFCGPGQGRGDGVDALAIAKIEPASSGYDRSWLSLETLPDISRDRLRGVLGSAGIEATLISTPLRGESRWVHLVEATGMVLADDVRIARILEPKNPVLHCTTLGGYPVPFSAEDLND